LGDDYVVKALDAVLWRRFGTRLDTPESRAAVFLRRTGGDLTPNERGRVLMDVALLAPCACVYLFDETMNKDGTGLCSSEEFSRIVLRTYCGDCEDVSHTTVMALRAILRSTSLSPVIAELRRIRMQYVAVIMLNSISRTSPTDPNERATCTSQLSSHDTPDLIPLRFLERALVPCAAVSRLVRERSAELALYDANLCTVTGEGIAHANPFFSERDDLGTANVDEFDRAASVVLDLLSASGAGFATTVMEYDSRKSFGFYRYATTAIVDDTLRWVRRDNKNVPDWKCVHLTFAAKTGSILTCGAPHDAYVRCDLSKIAVLQPPDPTDEQLEALAHLEKFEHPAVALRYPPTNDTAAYDRIEQCLREWVDSTAHRKQNGNSLLIPIYASLWSMSDNSVLASIKHKLSELQSNVQLVDRLNIVHIAEGLAVAELFFAVII
jgi:hypothetical protein